MPDPDPDPDDDDDIFLPAHVITFLAHFSLGKIERACVPQSPEIDAILFRTFSHEIIEPYNPRLKEWARDELWAEWEAMLDNVSSSLR